MLAGAGEGLKGNGKALSAALKRFDPTARDLQEIGYQLDARHANTARAIHNFGLLIEALGGKDQQLSELVVSANTVFKTFAKEEQNVQSTLRLLPGALGKAQQGLGKLATAANVLGPTLKELQPFAKALGPAEEASQASFIKTTPIIKNQIRPFARQILPVITEIGPATKELSEAFPKLASSFAVFNELFNEFAYNPGSSKGGFLFYLAWANHDFNSSVSSADAHGALGNTLPYFNCNVVPILKGPAKRPTVKLPPARPAERSDRGGLYWGGCDRKSERGTRIEYLHGLDGPAHRAHRQCVLSEPRHPHAQHAGGRRQGRRLSDAEARPHAGQHPRDHPVRAELHRAAAVHVGVLRRGAAAEAEGVSHDDCLPARAGTHRTVGSADLGRRYRPMSSR